MTAMTARPRCAPALPLSNARIQQKVREYLNAALASNTRKAYQNDLAHFVAYGGKIPATPARVASYLAVCAQSLSVATLSRRVVAINQAHLARGLDSPTKSALVAATLRGIRRVNGSAQRQVAPLLKADLVHMVQDLTSMSGLRDKALLLTGFAGGFRRSELVAIQLEDVHFVQQGVVIHVPRSKTDQTGLGRPVAIPFVKNRHCPVRALKASKRLG